jgi:hypothetical protein
VNSTSCTTTRDGLAPRLRAAQVLRLAVVSLQAGEAQGRVLADLVRQVDRGAPGSRRSGPGRRRFRRTRRSPPPGVPAAVAGARSWPAPGAHAFHAVDRDRELALLGRELVREVGHPRQLGGAITSLLM